MNSSIAVTAQNLGKAYYLGGQDRKYRTFRDALLRKLKNPFSAFRRQEIKPFWALRNLDMEIGQGEVVGIIGQNGAGKSTLLKILTRITRPTEGKALLNGRTGSLLEVGTGFHPELTGRENIFLSGAILGMQRAEIRDKFDDIVAFAEIDRFLDTPVKHYSSGMYVRLGFAIAAHLEPEILLIDEVLAVGDAAFQKKCLGKMGDVASRGRTVLFVSHNMQAVRTLCPRAILLKDGKTSFDGPSGEAINRYLMASSEDLAAERKTIDLPRPAVVSGPSPLRIAKVALAAQSEKAIFKCGEKNRLTLDFIVTKPVSQVVFGASVHVGNTLIFQVSSGQPPGKPVDLQPGTYTIETDLPFELLNPGLYTLHAGSRCEAGSLDWVVDALTFRIQPASDITSLWMQSTGGLVRAASTWSEPAVTGNNGTGKNA